MSVMTNISEDNVLNTMRGTNYTSWTPWAALLTAVTDAEAGTVTEIAYTGYARQQVTFGAPTNVSGAQQIANSTQVNFPQMTGGAGGTATHLALYDASTAGTIRYVIPLTASQSITNGTTPQIAVGALTVSQN